MGLSFLKILLNMKEIVSKKYKEIFNKNEAFVVRSPGRINIIGEHTDYNEGFVLPAAIDKGIYVAIGKRDDTEKIGRSVV